MKGLLSYLRKFIESATRVSNSAEVPQVSQVTIYAILILFGCLVPCSSKTEISPDSLLGGTIDELLKSVKLYVLVRLLQVFSLIY
jgi:hypothetical protein